MIPVYIFNPLNLISSSTSFASLMKKSFNQAVALDCAGIESKTEFFTEIFEGIISKNSCEKLSISYDFSAFLTALKPLKKANGAFEDIVIIFNNSSQINLSHLDDFVRLWERKSKTLPKLKFVFDDSVSSMGMEARLRDRFRIKEINVPRVHEVFDDFVIEMVNNELPFLLHPQLMKRFVDLTISETISLNSILNQVKFLLISHFNTVIAEDPTNFAGLKDVFLFITELSLKLKKIRPSAPLLSPSKDFYSVVLGGILVDSQAFAEIVNELKSLAPNDFVSLFPQTCEESKSKLNLFVTKMIDELKVKLSNSNSSQIKDFQLDLITSLSNFLRSYEISIPSAYVITDQKGNVRRAFEADPLTALQVALKYPSVYLNCKNCCLSSSEEIASVPLSSTNLNSRLAPLFHNKSTMFDVCLLYRLSLEFPYKSINLMSWYKSFSSIVTKKQNDKPLIT